MREGEQNSTRLSRNFDFDRGMYAAPLIEHAAANHKSVSTTSKGVPMIDRMLPFALAGWQSISIARHGNS